MKALSFWVILAVGGLVSQVGVSADPPPSSPPAGDIKRAYTIEDDLKIVARAIKTDCKASCTDLKLAGIYYPAFNVENGQMRLEPLLANAAASFVKDHDVIYRIQFNEGGARKVCYVTISDFRGRPAAAQVSIGSCGQPFQGVLKWKAEATVFVSIQAARADAARAGRSPRAGEPSGGDQPDPPSAGSGSE